MNILIFNHYMKRLTFILLLCILTLPLLAQEGPGEPLAIEKMTEELSSANKTLQKEMAKLEKKLNKLLRNKVASLNPGQLDSLTKFQLPVASVDSIKDLAKVIRIPEPGTDQLGIDKLTTKVDSLAGLLDVNKLSLEKYLGAKLNGQFLDSLQSLMPDTELGKIGELQSKILSSSKITPPDLDIAKQLQVTITELDELKLLYAKIKLPELNGPNLESVLSDDIIPKGRFDKLMKKAGSFEEILDKYTAEFENWDQKLLERVTSLEEVAKIQKLKDRIDKYEFLPEGYRKNMDGMQTNDFVKKKLEAKAEELKKVGAKSLQEKLDAAQAKISEAKEKFPSLESVEEAPKRPENPYKGDPFLKRLKLGGNFQVNRQEPASVDASLRVSYLMNQNARFGFGGSYRIGTEKRLKFNFDDQVLGLKTFFDYTIFRSVYAEALYEWNLSEVPAQDDVSFGKQWKQSGMLGLGNRFKVSKKVNGNFIALYNFFHDETSPHPNPWVVRFGFEL
ncbi:MAG: hypothetical protein HEP71_08160 [Roseivirga sp.]|nr:hypothetical protein [Roseivirga sp.]